MSILNPQASNRRSDALRNPRFHARLRKLIGNEAPYAWAERMGISKGAFTRIWKEGTVPTSELLYRIRAATGVSLDWLLTGQGKQANGGGETPGLVYIGEYKPAAKGQPKRRAPAQGKIGLMRDWLHTRLDADPAKLCYVTVSGESMAPTLADGDLVLIDRGATLEREGIYALLQGGTLRIRRVQRLPGKRYQAIADNGRYHPFTFRASAALSVVGRVVWAGKRM